MSANESANKYPPLEKLILAHEQFLHITYSAAYSDTLSVLKCCKAGFLSFKYIMIMSKTASVFFMETQRKIRTDNHLFLL
jgi:hypothetical protein